MAITANTVITQVQNSPLAFLAGFVPAAAAALFYRRKYKSQKNSGPMGNLG